MFVSAFDCRLIYATLPVVDFDVQHNHRWLDSSILKTNNKAEYGEPFILGEVLIG